MTRFRSSGSDGSRTPTTSSDRPRRSRTRQRRPCTPSLQTRTRSSSSRSSSHSASHAADEIYNNDWDLVKPPEKSFPNWDTYENVANTFRQYTHKTIKHLTRHELLENMPTTPSPQDIATLNRIQNLVRSWRIAEERLSRENGLTLKGNKYADERAWTSWVRTQSRDFGSAVWRWLRLSRWNETQSPRMKGLWHQAVYGDWNKVPNIDFDGGDSEVIQEWMSNQGLEKGVAQQQFIDRAENLGIPPVHWERPLSVYDSPKCIEWEQKSIAGDSDGLNWGSSLPFYDAPKCIEWREKSIGGGSVGLITGGNCQSLPSLPPETPKLLSRSPEPLALGSSSEKSYLGELSGESPQPVELWLGLSFVSGLFVSLWATLVPLLNAGYASGVQRRLHPRAWNQIED